jgi:hypothetical protein
VFPLEVRAKAIERSNCLSLRDATNERTADNRADGAERWVEFVSVVKPRATVLGGEAVLGLRTRARRSATLPYGQLVGTALDELPVNLDVDSTQVYLLVHLIADPQRTLVGVQEAAVNGDPIAKASGIHHHLPYLGGRDVYAGRGRD